MRYVKYLTLVRESRILLKYSTYFTENPIINFYK